MSERHDDDHDFKVIEDAGGGWIVLDPEGRQVAGPFDEAVEAAQWARAEIIRRQEATQ